MPEREFLTPTDLEAAGIATVETLSNWRFKGRGPRWHKLNGSIRYRRSDVDEWLRTCARETAPVGVAAREEAAGALALRRKLRR